MSTLLSSPTLNQFHVCQVNFPPVSFSGSLSGSKCRALGFGLCGPGRALKITNLVMEKLSSLKVDRGGNADHLPRRRRQNIRPHLRVNGLELRGSCQTRKKEASSPICPESFNNRYIAHQLFSIVGSVAYLEIYPTWETRTGRLRHTLCSTAHLQRKIRKNIVSNMQLLASITDLTGT